MVTITNTTQLITGEIIGEKDNYQLSQLEIIYRWWNRYQWLSSNRTFAVTIEEVSEYLKLICDDYVHER